MKALPVLGGAGPVRGGEECTPPEDGGRRTSRTDGESHGRNSRFCCNRSASRPTSQTTRPNWAVRVSSSIKIFEYVFGVEEFGINSLRGKKFAANDKDFCRNISGELLLVTLHECWTRNHTGRKGALLPQLY